MSSKRANGEGTIFRTSDGRWKAVISLGCDANGRRRRRSKVANTRADAAALLREMQNALGTNQPVVSQARLGDFLSQWLDTKVKANSAESTEALWRHACNRHVVPHIGHVRIDRLSALDVERLLTALAGEKSRIRQVAFDVLRNAMNYAANIGAIAANPCLKVERPRHHSEKIKPFTADEARQLVKATAEDRLHALYVLAFTTGMRQGELFGLHWTAVDLKAGTIRVEMQAAEVSGKVTLKRPKTKASVRTIELTPAAVEVLVSHRAATLKAGRAGGKLVFAAPGGGTISRGNFRVRSWKPLLKLLKIEHRGFHHVRHTFASLALGDGVPVHVVSRILGHSRVSVTLDTYAHALQTHQSEATQKIARIFAG